MQADDACASHLLPLPRAADEAETFKDLQYTAQHSSWFLCFLTLYQPSNSFTSIHIRDIALNENIEVNPALPVDTCASSSTSEPGGSI